VTAYRLVDFFPGLIVLKCNASVLHALFTESWSRYRM